MILALDSRGVTKSSVRKGQPADVSLSRKPSLLHVIQQVDGVFATTNERGSNPKSLVASSPERMEML